MRPRAALRASEFTLRSLASTGRIELTGSLGLDGGGLSGWRGRRESHPASALDGESGSLCNELRSRRNGFERRAGRAPPLR